VANSVGFFSTLLASRRAAWLAVVLLVLGGLVLSGCSQSSFVGQRWSNFTAYYNTFYNAKQAFDEGVNQVAQREERIDGTRLIALFETPEPVRDPRHFDEAIDKSADILRRHGNSRYVDDALMLIGKSYYYLQNYVGAVEKFEEAAVLETSRRYEAQLWLGRSLIGAERYAEAASYLEGVLASDEDAPSRWRSQYWLALGAAEAYQERWEAARDALRLGAPATNDSRLEARGYFLLGQVTEHLERFDEAREAFESAARASADFELTYAARFHAIAVAGLQNKDQRAVQQAQRLGRDGAYYERRAEPAYLAARILQALDATDEARARYEGLLYDREAPLQDVEGRIHYGLAELYYHANQDYERAAAHYDTAATVLSRGRAEEATRPRSVFAITDAEEKRASFNQFAEAYREVAHTDSLLHLGSLTAEEFQAFVQDLREQRAAEQEAERQEQRRTEGTGPELRKDNVQDELQATADQAHDPAVGAGSGFLSYRDPVQVQDAQVGFVRRWGDRPLTPDWRRSSAARMQQVAERSDADTIETSEQAMSEDVIAQAEDGAVLPQVDVSEVPRDDESREAMRLRHRNAMYDVGNAFLLALDQPADAVAWYEQVLAEGSDDELSLRTLYALSQALRAMGDEEEAAAVEADLIATYPDSDVAIQLRQRATDAEPRPADERSARASAAYEKSFNQWETREDVAVPTLAQMLLIATAYDDTETAPQALFAAGTFLLEYLIEQGHSPHRALGDVLPSDVLEVTGFYRPDGSTGPIGQESPAGPEADHESSASAPTEVQAATMEVGPDAAQTRAAALALLHEYQARTQDAETSVEPLMQTGVQLDDSLNGGAATSDVSPRSDTPLAPDLTAMSDASIVRVGVMLPEHLRVEHDPDAARTQAPTVAHIFERLITSYPAARSIARAEQVLQALDDQSEDPAEDPADALVAEGEGQQAEDDASEDAAEEAQVAGIPGPEEDVASTAFTWQAGQFALSLVTWDDQQFAERSAATFRDRLEDDGLEVTLFVVEEDGEPIYHVGAGPFPSSEEAEEALEALEGRVPSGATVQEVPAQPEATDEDS